MVPVAMFAPEERAVDVSRSDAALAFHPAVRIYEYASSGAARAGAVAIVAAVAATRAVATNVRVFIACLLVVFCITGMMVARPWFSYGTAHRDAIHSSKSKHPCREKYDNIIGKNATWAQAHWKFRCLAQAP